MIYTVIIATSQKRTDWLINRSLYSVYNQVGISKSEWSVIIIDDNEDIFEFNKIKNQITQLRQKFNLEKNEYTTIFLRNQKTRFMSGTGAWNTGIYHAYSQNPYGFISILDDDDFYLPNHLLDCIKSVKKNTVAVFQRLIWENEDSIIVNTELTKEKLTAENFFIGNPGVQGSNMFFKTQNFIDIDGFDEMLPNTTDRDLMIRFLWKNDIDNINILETIGVIHYNHKRQKVNNNIALKKQGLDFFYKKYRCHFSAESYQESLKRASAYFNYIPFQD
jgi:hypothetical protein